MFSLTSSHRYYLYDQPTDMRKSFDGLSGIVQGQLQRDPTNGSVYVFINKKRNRIKHLSYLKVKSLTTEFSFLSKRNIGKQELRIIIKRALIDFFCVAFSIPAP